MSGCPDDARIRKAKQFELAGSSGRDVNGETRFLDIVFLLILQTRRIGIGHVPNWSAKQEAYYESVRKQLLGAVKIFSRCLPKVVN